MCCCLHTSLLSTRNKLICVLALLSFFNFHFAYSQQNQYRYYTTDDGLPSNTIGAGGSNMIYQDKDGFIWFATFGGIAIYDGYHFNNHTKENGGLTTDVALNFFVGNNNEVWVIEPNCID